MKNSNNNNGRFQNTISFATSSWGTFSSRYDRQPNYKKSENNARSSLNEQNNIAGDVTSQYQSNLEVSDGDNLGNRSGAGGGSFDTKQSNFNDHGISSGSYGNEKSNDLNYDNEQDNGNDDSQLNSNDFESKQDQMNSNFIGCQQNQANSNNFGSQQNRSNSNNFESQQNRSNSNNFGSQHNRLSSNNFGPQQNRMNNNNFGSQQNRSNSNNFGPRKYQSNTNNMNNSNTQVGSWLSGPGRGSYGNNSNNGIFQNSNQQNQSNSNDGNSTSSNSNYVPFGKFRQHFSKNSSHDNAPPPSLFMGRDQSYPNELNHLMNPFFCGVCNSRLNSIKSANIHYESKAHDKQISNWMKKTFADKGLAVPEVQRFVSEEAIGPYRCELCKVDLTSAQHALQHYNGKRHRQAATKISPPTGIGYYNVDGNWVETGKVMDKVTGKETSYILVNTPSGFEPVVLHVAPNVVAGVKRPAELQLNKSEEQPAKKFHIDETHDADKEKIKTMKEEQYRTMVTEYEKNKQQQNTTKSTTNNQFKTVSLESQDSSPTGQTPQEALESQQCKLCGIATTSHDQMLLHLKGARHTKKLRALGKPPISDLFEKSTTTILESLDSNNPSDVSMYRTPSGSYYCKTCNVGVEDVARIKKHISSKAHLAASKKSVEKPVIS